MDVSNNPYLASLTRRLNETYDTSKFKKNPPYKLALASQGPTNSWATLFDAHARWEVSKLGKDPKTGQNVYARYGRYGPVLQLGETPEKDEKDAPKPRFAPLPTDSTLDTITLKDALPMFKLPREVGKTSDGDAISLLAGYCH